MYCSSVGPAMAKQWATVTLLLGNSDSHLFTAAHPVQRLSARCKRCMKPLQQICNIQALSQGANNWHLCRGWGTATSGHTGHCSSPVATVRPTCPMPVAVSVSSFCNWRLLSYIKCFFFFLCILAPSRPPPLPVTITQLPQLSTGISDKPSFLEH